ncbi:5'/3'-nucleotidase SurE [bacterium]|nr:5'/3'-nucleotidase SurE [candidate division CSSED10-310 bacterium]
MILLTNDDGVAAPGIRHAFEVLRELDEVMVVAPDRQMSATGHGITVDADIMVRPVTIFGGASAYEVAGTPADCVKVALAGLCPRPPALVVSGINLGANSGTNVFYSGTVAAAMEGTILGCQAMAVSLATFTAPHFETAARYAGRLAAILLGAPLPGGVFLNVNVPNVEASRIMGVAVTRQGTGRYGDEYAVAPRGDAAGYRLVGDYYMPDLGDGGDGDGYPSDDDVLGRMLVSVTPMRLVLTAGDEVARMRELFVGLGNGVTVEELKG